MSVTEDGRIAPGPPSTLTPEVRDEIIDRMLAGEALTHICADEGMPSRQIVYRFMHQETDEAEEFRRRYDRAFALRYRVIAEEILMIADDAEDDYVERTNEDGEPVILLSRDNIQRSALRVKARQWMLERLSPERFGRTTKIVGDPDRPVGNAGFTIVQVNYGDLPPEAIKIKQLPGGFRRIGEEDDAEDI